MALARPFRTSIMSLGAVAPTAGTPKTLTSNYTDLGGAPFGVITVRALAGNTGNVYILNSSSAADTSNYLNVVEILIPGGFWSTSSSGVNMFVASQYYIDVDSTGAKAVVTVTER